MPLLPLPVIGWLYTISAALALAIGAALVLTALRGGEEARAQLAHRKLEDSLLFGLWIVGLAGGVGLLLGKPWSAPALEFLSWVLIGLTLYSVVSRVRAIGLTAPGVGMRLFGLALFALPIIAVCAATILTLRSDAAARALGAG